MRHLTQMFCNRVAAIVVLFASSSLPCARAQAITPAATPASSAAAAKTAPNSTTPPAYAAESIVIVHSDSDYTFAADGTGTQMRTIVARVQSDAAVRELGVVSVAYAANSQHVEFLYARVRHPDGTIVETPASDSLDVPEPVTSAAPFYSDLKDKQLPIRGLRVGDTLEWKARITTTKSEAPGEFWGRESFPDKAVVLSETVELRIPVGIAVNVWSPTIKPVESVENGQHVYRWTSSQLKPTAGKQAEAAAEAKKQVVWTAAQELDADQGKLPTIAWTTFKSWEAVGGWYQSLEAGRIASSPEIKAKVAELIAGKSTEEEKIRAIYAYVSTQIRYIGVAFGVGRYQPHTAAEIFSNQYGDCKDKHTLLASMLSVAGIQSDAALIGAGIRFNPAVPSPASFNHLITYLTLSAVPGQPAQPVWLDTTAEIAPYRMLVSVIRNKQALVVPDVGQAHLERTPADPPFPSFLTMDAVGSLDKNGISHSRITLVLRGDSGLAVRAAFHQTAPAQYDALVQQLLNGMGYAGTTSNAIVSSPDDTSQPFKISFDYEREKAGDWDNYRIIPQLAPVGLPRFGDTDPLVRSLNLGTPRIETSHSAMKLPEGWGATLPEAVHVKSPYATYDESYRLDKGTVYAERRIEILKQKIPTSDLEIYKKWADDADLGNESYIQLTRTAASVPIPSATATPKLGTSNSTPSDGPPVVSPDSDEEQHLWQQASDLYQQHDYDGTIKLLDQVKALNPERPYLWSIYGGLAVLHGQIFEAIDDFKKELKLHPDSLLAYPELWSTQMAVGEKKDAIATLRAWTTADPSNPDAAARLMNSLLDDGDAVSALAAGESALVHLPKSAQKDESFQIALGRAQIASGEKDKGTATLASLLKTSQNPGVLNNAAYFLADASLDLPLAETTVRNMLDKLSQESNSWTLNDDPQTLTVKTRLIVATWDTLGWIFFREGKLDQALSYLQAGWMNSLNLECGKHLGDLMAARGDKSDALNTYDLALAGASPLKALDGKPVSSLTVDEIGTRVKALRKSSIRPSAQSASESLQKLRIIRLGRTNSHDGDSEYHLLLKDGKTVKVEPVGSKSIRGAKDMLTKVSFSAFFPKDSSASLFRDAFINCYSGTCELVFAP